MAKNTQNHKLENVFIVGSPRSGKTLLQSLLAFHPEFGWFSQYYSRCRFLPAVGALNRIYDIPGIGKFLAARDRKFFLPRPVEMAKDYNCKLASAGVLTGNEVKEKDKKKLREVFEAQLKIQKKDKFLTDYGRPARMLYFKKIFPSAKFIHVLRDGRNVTADFLKERPEWFNKNRDISAYYNNPPENLKKKLMQHKGTSNYTMVLAALRWKMAIMELEKQSKKLVEKDYLIVKYEDLIHDKFGVVEKCLKFLHLEPANMLNNVVSARKFYHENIWESYFNFKTKNILNDLLGDILVKYNYVEENKE